jgi:hypothetical protein
VCSTYSVANAIIENITLTLLLLLLLLLLSLQVQDSLQLSPCSPAALRHIPSLGSPAAASSKHSPLPNSPAAAAAGSKHSPLPNSPAAAAAGSKHSPLPNSPAAAAAVNKHNLSPKSPAAAAAAGAGAIAGAVADSSSGSSSEQGGLVVCIHGVDVRNHNGDTPLMFAASSGHLGATALLLNVRREGGVWRWGWGGGRQMRTWLQRGGGGL